MRLAGGGIDLDLFLKKSGCRERRCAFDVSFLIDRLAYRVVHNGVRFSHATDIDSAFSSMVGDQSIEHLIELWCGEHHAGRDGHQIAITAWDGTPDVLLVPEAVG
jgi:hypothetical protein